MTILHIMKKNKLFNIITFIFFILIFFILILLFFYKIINNISRRGIINNYIEKYISETSSINMVPLNPYYTNYLYQDQQQILKLVDQWNRSIPNCNNGYKTI